MSSLLSLCADIIRLYLISQNSTLSTTVQETPGTSAPDAQCTIQLDITDTHAELLVINPLANHHHDQQLSSGLGLLSIQERTRALGGTTTITPTDHQWILHTTLPLTPKDTP